MSDAPLQNQVNIITQDLLNDINKGRDRVFDGLISNPIIRRLPENIFKNYFLPCMLGQVTNPNWVVEWISIAGSPSQEVTIFSDSTQEDLFIVPGLISTQNVILNRTRSGSFQSVFDHQANIARNSPNQATNFIYSNLQTKTEELNISNQLSMSKWEIIFNRYGIKFKDNNTNIEQTNNDMFEY